MFCFVWHMTLPILYLNVISRLVVEFQLYMFNQSLANLSVSVLRITLSHCFSVSESL